MQKSQSAKNFVGRVTTGGLNYHKDTHAFDSSMVPDKARDAVAEIRELTAADILCLKPPAWNKSTYVDRTKYYTDQLPLRKKKFEIHIGLQDFHELEPHANKVYQGTELRNDYAGWNVSTYFEQNELKKRLKSM